MCVPDAEACAQGQAGYQLLRDQLLAEPSALHCAQDGDCKILGNFPYCGDECQMYLVGAPSVAIEQQLAQFQSDHCATCEPTANPCIRPPPPVCVAGACVSGLK